MRTTGGKIALAVLPVLVVALVGAQPATLATFTVVNTNNSGDGSLRQAIIDANAASGGDTITFGIPGAGPHTIQPLSPLPAITGPTVLDATTQSGFAGSPIVELDGSQAGTSDGLSISASGPVLIKGLVVNRFTREGIQISGTGAVTLHGNYIGTDVSGTAARPNGLRGVLVNGGSGHTIGGVGAGEGNLISGNSNVGIGIFSSKNNTVVGNRIGTDAAGNSPVPNGPAGVQIYGGDAPFGADNNTIGGTAFGAGNVISGNTGPGILLNTTGTSPSASNNVIQGNLIGTDASGNYDLGNSGVNGHGISIANVGGIADNTIGGTGEGAANTIAYNDGDGISIQTRTDNPDPTPDPPHNVGNEIRGNEIYSNGGLGIDLGPNGPTPNDGPPDSDTGANDLQNVPILNADLSSTTTIAGDLYSAPALTYTIDVYAGTGCDPSGFGEGEAHVTSFQVTTDSPGGHASFSEPISIGGLSRLTATATDSSGNTSEFSPCVDVGGGGEPAADLVVDSIAFTPGATPYGYTVTVRNAGTATADLTGGVVQGYYSTDTTIDGADAPACGVTMTGTLAPGATTDVPVGCSLAPGEGHNYLLVHVDRDNNVAESDDTNNVGIAPLDGPEGSSPPVLFLAVPDATLGTLGVAGFVEQEGLPADTAFEVRFYSSEACDDPEPSQIGTSYTVVTNENGIAAFALEVALTPMVSVGTAVRARARLGGGPLSDFSNCVIADRANTVWPTAFALSAVELPGSVSETGSLRELGEARWFKVPILPNSRMHITLKDLPADYDLVVFGDIQAAYDRIVGGESYDPEAGPSLALDDLNQAGADTQADAFNTSQYNPSSWEATNWDPELNTAVYSPSQWSPSQWSPSQWSATQFSPSQWSPSQWSPSQWSPSQWSPSQWSPSQWSPSQWSPSQWSSSNPADPEAFTAAQLATVLAISGGTGTGDERISVNTWNNTGFFYIRVQGKNGSFDPDTPFTLDVARQGNLCSGVEDQPSAPTVPAGDRRTLVLVDSSRLTIPSALGTKLASFAARPEVDGVVVDVSSDGVVNSLNAQADDKTECPYAKNLVASAIKRIVDAYRATNPIEHVVVIGDDDVIPFFRYPDPALLGNETMYVPPVRDDTASQASLRLGYILNQDGYASSESVSLHGNLFPVPDLPIGRLVETAQEIEGMLDAYLGTADGVVPPPTSALVTGYDFLTDTADTIADHFDAGIGAAANEELITNQTTSPGVVSDGNDNAESYYRTRSWTGVDLRRELIATGRDLVFLAGHFSANDALAADYQTNVLSTELPASSTDYENAIVFSAGCHAGYNIVNPHATQWTEPLDWAQAFARKKATLIAGTGYQYGDTDFMAHSERIYAEFARQLRVTTDSGGAPIPVAVGSALLRAKQIFLETTPGLTALDEKSLLQTTLFGLPMLSVNLPQGRIVETPEGSVIGSLTDVTSGPGAVLGLEFAELGVAPALTADQKQLRNTDGTNGPLATWLSGSDGVAVRPTQPILPLESLNVTVPGTALRGVGFRSGTYTDTPGVTPLTAAPATELRGVHAPFFTDVFFPLQPWTTNYFGAIGESGATRLHTTPVQHRSNSPTATRRQFGNVDLRLFYSSNVSSYCAGTNPLQLAPCPGDVAIAPALAAPPTITGVQTEYDDATDELTFQARALGHLVAGIQSVWVTWTVPPGSSGGSGSWQSLDLVQDTVDPTLWTGTLTGVSNASAVHFLVQAVNGVGRVTIDDNVGAFYRHGAIPGPLAPGAPAPSATAMTFITPPPTSVAYGQSFAVTVELAAGGNPVSGKIVRIGFGGTGIPATTGSGGRATVELRAALTPGSYTVTGSFAGDAALAASDVSTNVTVEAQPTTLTLTGTLLVSDPLTATLKTDASPAAPLHQRNVSFIMRAADVTRVHVGKTDPLGRVVLPDTLLTTLPPRSYTVDAYFNGVNVAGVLVLPPDNVDYKPSTAHAAFTSWVPFSGFFSPVANPPTFNVTKAGNAVPVKFSLGGNRGLNVFDSGYPKVTMVSCESSSPSDPIEETVSAGGSSLQYDASTGRYTYVWKTDRKWQGTCRKLLVRFKDGTEREALFRFT